MSREAFVEAFPNPVLYPISIKGNPAPPAHELTPSSGKRVVSLKQTLAAPARNGDGTLQTATSAGIAYDRRVGILAKRPKNLFPHMISVGRAMTSDLVYLVDTVSKFHGYFVHQEGSWSFTDQRSSNGTTLNGERMEAGSSRKLADGDKLSLGVTVETQFLSPGSLYDVLHGGSRK